MHDCEIKYKNEDREGETSAHGNSTTIYYVCFELLTCAQV